MTGPAVLIADAPAPGTAEWLRYMTGSKIAAVMRLSPYESAYSLWHRMAGIIPPEEPSEQMRRGHYLEPSILAWLVDQNPGVEFGARGSMWASAEHPAYAITPDALGTDRATGQPVLIEAKSALDKDIWGDELSDEIPVYYRCQVMWGMGILGIDRCIVGVLTSYLEFRQYEVAFDPADFALLLDAAGRFMDSLAVNDKPDIDSHAATYEVIRQLHPDIEDRDVEIGEELGRRYIDACVAMRRAEAENTEVRSLVADRLGNGRRALMGKVRLAYRRTGKPGHPPYLTVASGLAARYDTTELEYAS